MSVTLFLRNIAVDYIKTINAENCESPFYLSINSEKFTNHNSQYMRQYQVFGFESDIVKRNNYVVKKQLHSISGQPKISHFWDT